jgi:hypothetical protein
MGKLKIDRLYLTNMESNRNRLGSVDSKNPKIVYTPLIYRLYAVDAGQNKRTVSAVANTRKVTTVSANQPMVEVSTDSCYTETS